MTWLAILLPFVLVGSAVLFIAFSGGPAAAREAYLTRGNRAFRVIIPILYVVAGIAIPAAIIASRDEAEGGVGHLRNDSLTKQDELGKRTFQQTCASCHSLAAVNARGVTGPNLDEIGEVSKNRVLTAIRIGGTGQKRMPAGLLSGESADAVASYVSKVAGK